MQAFDAARPRLEKQYENAVFDPATGWSREDFEDEFARYDREFPDEPPILQRARRHAATLRHAPLFVEPDNPFAGKLQSHDLLSEDRSRRVREVWTREFGEFNGWCSVNDMERGVGYMVDMSHVAPDWERVLELGLPGLRARAAAAAETGDAAASPMLRAAVLLYDAMIDLCERLGRLCRNDAYAALARRAPATLPEAFQLAYILHEAIELGGAEVRSMGRFDRLYWRFYQNDLAAGRLTRETAKEWIKYFWIAFYAKYQGRRFGKNFCFGPEINGLSYLGMEAYHEMNTVDPKLSVRYRDDMPADFLAAYARCIADGRTGVVTLNDPVVIEGLERHGRTPEDAREYIPIGCYEPAVAGKEVSLSGATHLHLPTLVLRTLARADDCPDFDAFMAAFFDETREQIGYMAAQQSRCEKIWPEINPVPLLSATFDACVASGKDIAEGGAVYNTTGCVVSYFADAVDSLAAVRTLVYETKRCSAAELRQALADDWNGHEALRRAALRRPPHWGNGDDAADSLGKMVADFVAPTMAARGNGRGGKMFPSLYGQLVVENGALMGALPNGRRAGEPLSKNMDARTGMDENGVTALMNSVLKIDMRQYPCGTCLDIMLHPSAVAGREGLAALGGLIRAFMAGGGSGLQFNIFDAATLREARRRPEDYRHLQVRVCGWNTRFIDLSPESQATFIEQAETCA